MSEATNQFEGQSNLQSSVVTQMSDATAFRSAPSTSMGIPAPSGPVSLPPATVSPPPLPPKPDMSIQQQNFGMNQGYYGMGSYGVGGYGGYGYNGMGGGYGMGGMGMGAMAPYGGYNRFGGNMYGADNMESRFVQMAEEHSRHAFDSIQGVVNAVGSVAMMLESTFFALTSSFRAILGVAENFGRLRSLFGQFWSTFAVFRTLNWIIRKLLVMLGIRTECEFKAWAEAVSSSQPGAVGSTPQAPRPSSWPVMLFFAVIAAAPYIVHKMLSGLSSSINEKLHDPSTWQSPLRAITDHAFQATSAQELSFSANQTLFIAPQHLQGQLWTSGWLMASADMQHAGLVPVNYIKIVKPVVVSDKEEAVQLGL